MLINVKAEQKLLPRKGSKPAGPLVYFFPPLTWTQFRCQRQGRRAARHYVCQHRVLRTGTNQLASNMGDLMGCEKEETAGGGTEYWCCPQYCPDQKTLIYYTTFHNYVTQEQISATTQSVCCCLFIACDYSSNLIYNVNFYQMHGNCSQFCLPSSAHDLLKTKCRILSLARCVFLLWENKKNFGLNFFKVPMQIQQYLKVCYGN
jgi:hypothetical protein